MADRPRVGFLFNTKDRVELTTRSLRSIDLCSGFELIWADGSRTPEGKALPHNIKLKNFQIAELHQDVRPKHTDPRSMSLGANLGSHTAIHFGMARVLERGYDYCGIIENDIEFQPGWFPKLMELFELGKRDGMEVGAVTARSMTTRVMAYRPEYLVMWNIGAGMVLFTQEAARLVMATYAVERSASLARFFQRNFGADFKNVWELWYDQPNRDLSPDWAFSKYLYKYGLASLGTIPSLAANIDMDVVEEFRSGYVPARPPVTPQDDLAFRRVQEYLARKDRGPERQKLAYALDRAGGDFFRAQLHNRGLRTFVFYAKRVVRPVYTARSLKRKLQKKKAKTQG